MSSQASLGRAASTTPLVSVRGVSHIYEPDVSRKAVLTQVDLTLHPGQFVVLTGPSGSGKTTLLTLIGAIRSLQQGEITTLGLSLAGRSQPEQREVRKRIGFIFQEHNLFSAISIFRTLWLTTELGERSLTREEAQARATQLLARLEMQDYLHALPRTLSTGQRQRVAIARALINRPRLILGDEPTASLDQPTAAAVIGLIREEIAASGGAALVVTHDSRLFAGADRVLHLVDGRLEEN